MKLDCFVSVVAPLYNDAEIVAAFAAETLAVLEEHFTNYELVLVDDDSEDATLARVKGMIMTHRCMRLIPLSRRFGQEVAISAGLESVIGDFVVVMLPDGDPPALIPTMVERCRQGADILFGVNQDQGQRLLYRMGSALFHAYCRRSLGVTLPRGATQFRCLSRQAVNAILQIKDSFRYLTLLSAYVGYGHEQFSYRPASRRGEVRRRGLIESVNRALAVIVENSAHPLRLLSWLGLTAALGNLIYIGYIVSIYVFKAGVAEGWVTLSLQNAGEFIILALMLTGLSEYTGRILNRLLDRPLYYAREEINSAVLLTDAERPNIVHAVTHPAESSDGN